MTNGGAPNNGARAGIVSNLICQQLLLSEWRQHTPN